MPEANLVNFNLEGKNPAELEARRREIIATITTKYKGHEDPDVPTSLLQELAVVTGTLRRKNAGPPKKAKEPAAAKGKAKPTISSVLDML